MSDESQHELLLASVDRCLAGDGSAEALRDFAARYFAAASHEILTQRSPEALAAIVCAQHDLVRRRSPGEPVVRITPPPQDDPTALARLESLCDDMPFVVDSLSIAVRDTGSSVDWSVHPVLRVRRDESGALLALEDDDGGQPESLVCMEITPLPAAEDYEALRARAEQALRDIALIAADFPAMRQRCADIADTLQPPLGELKPEWIDEAREFATWLADHHFTFLGYAFAEAEGGKEARNVRVAAESCLGLLRPDACFGDIERLLASAETLNRYAASPRLVVVTKANARSHIHHPLTLDAISIKQLDADGRLRGTHRFIGLFSGDVYVDRPQNIPVVRQRVQEVLRRSRLSPESHSGKKLRDILHQLPRDELFQSSEEELTRVCNGVRALRDRHRLRLFLRRDRYGRFYSALLFLPRERYSAELRDTLCEELRAQLDGDRIERSVEFPRGENFARLHVIVHVSSSREREVDVAAIESHLQEATRSWPEKLRAALGAQAEGTLALSFLEAFDAGYQQENSPVTAALDVHCLMQLSADKPLLSRLVIDEAAVGPSCPTELRLYAHGAPMVLSDILPTLEHFGMRVHRQSPHPVQPKGADATLWVQIFDVRFAGDCAIEPAAQKRLFEEALSRCIAGETEDDGLHRLVLGAGLSSRRIVLLRTLTRYLLQTGLPYGRHMLESLLADHPAIARDLVALFAARFDPDLRGDREADIEAVRARLGEALEAVASLDADRGLRAYLGVVEATLRTNYYQPDANGQPKSRVAIKLDPGRMPELPEPRPVFEAFVYAPEVEGVHLRGGLVARGGLRWSDRPADFRTEVLGLMKAQMVKNAIIVPVGAKGGFVVKQRGFADREAFAAAGKACYQIFVRGLLDITDNRVGKEVVPPPRVLRADGDDPYLVVAADKGTATFSDTANALAAEYDFWLGDAFASGGSAGYDHKAMGITARGAWESVKRHFRELGKDIQSEPFTVVGIGDMSGDVFGNGMLLSEQIRLVAAFNHLHIFIDPDPDPATSFAERKRLFDMGRSSWEDYDRSKISEGGGIWSRDAKRIELSPQARAALGIDAEAVRPNELLRAILSAPVELLWNGGIGTYVKARGESHQSVGDRANDAIRVDGRELRCSVVGEGGNLGCTQLGRIEYAQLGRDGAGGYINTDAIDNSGGVHSSDREVNIKIPLNACMAAGELERPARDALLETMTEDVAQAVLADSHEQSLAVSLISAEAPVRLDEHAHTMRTLEREAGLSRSVEFLPDDEQLAERRSQRQGLTRPEIAVVLAYAKNALFDDLLASDVPDDPAFEAQLLEYFPAAMRRDYAEALRSHRLRRELIATGQANQLVNRMGFSFAHRLAEDQGARRPQVVRAFALAWQLMEGDVLAGQADALDGQVDGKVQLRLYQRLVGLMKHVTAWALAEHHADRPLQQALDRLQAPLQTLAGLLPDALPPAYREDWDAAVKQWRDDGVPETVARVYADTLVCGSFPDIVQAAGAAGSAPEQAAGVYFALGERLRIVWLLSAIVGLNVEGRYQALARANLREDTYRLHRRIVERVLAETEPAEPAVRVEAWLEAHGAAATDALARIEALRGHTPQDFMSLSVGVRALRQIRMF